MSEQIVVQDREELIYLLCEAAEFEHTVMCSYLYAQWTLKRDLDEGVTPTELAAIERWRRSLAQVALEEMLHLSLVNNLLAAIGAAPHLWRPAFPVRPGHFPADVVMSLTPFGDAALDHFMFIERPEGLDIADGAGFGHANALPADRASGHARARRRRTMRARGTCTTASCRGWRACASSSAKSACSSATARRRSASRSSACRACSGSTDLASAQRAIEEIVLQGEGAPAHRDDSHFARFSAIRKELAELRAARPDFEPARPVVRNPMLGDLGITHDRVRIVEPVAGAGGRSRQLDLRADGPRPVAGLRARAAAGRAAQRAGDDDHHADVGDEPRRRRRDPAARRSGAFDDDRRRRTSSCPAPPDSSCSSAPRASSASGRRSSPARRAGSAASFRCAGVADDLDALAQRYEDLHLRFETDLGAAVDRVAALVVPRPTHLPPRRPANCRRHRPADATVDVARTDAIKLRFEGRRCIHSRHCVLEAPTVFLANTPGAWIHPEATTVEHCVHVAHSCPSGAITYERHDGGPQESAPSVNVVRVRENGPYAVHAPIELPGGAEFRATLVPLRPVEPQALLRRQPCRGRIRRHRRAGHAPSEPLAERGGVAVDHARPQRPAATERQRRDLQRHRTNGVPDAVGAAVPLRGVGDQAVLRRLARARRVSVRRQLSAGSRGRQAPECRHAGCMCGAPAR